jgi:hypothetical protein
MARRRVRVASGGLGEGFGGRVVIVYVSPDQVIDALETILEGQPEIPYSILRLLETAHAWLVDGPCKHCESYHEPGSC